MRPLRLALSRSVIFCVLAFGYSASTGHQYTEGSVQSGMRLIDDKITRPLRSPGASVTNALS